MKPRVDIICNLRDLAYIKCNQVTGVLRIFKWQMELISAQMMQ